MKGYLYILLILILSSCSLLYVPTAVNTPLFEEKGQFSGNASILVTADVSAAYSVSNNLFIHTNYSLLLGDSSNTGNSKSFGIGYFKNIDNHIFELAGGVGFGEYEEKFTKYYIQPTWGWRLPMGDIAFSLKANALHYKSIESIRRLNIVETKSATDVYLEPVGTFRFGGKKLMFQVQTGASLPIRHESGGSWFPIVTNLGIHFRL